MSFGASIQNTWLSGVTGFGAPGFATTPGNEGALASLELPKMIQRASESPLWSTYKLGTAAEGDLANKTYKVFSVALDQAGQGWSTSLTYPETNIKEAGRIPSGAGYGVYGIAGQLYTVDTNKTATYTPTASDLWNVTSNCVLQWNMLDTVIDICPLNLAGAGGGVFGSTADTGGAYGDGNGSQVSLNNGAGQVWIYQFLPVLLPASTTFGVNLVFGQFAAPVDVNGQAGIALALRIVLLGTRRTAIPVG